MIKKNYKILALVLLITLFLLPEVYSQSKDTSFFKTIGNDFVISVGDCICTFSAPGRFSTSDWLKTGAVILTSTAFMPFDKDIKKELQKNQSDTKDKLADIGNAYGNLVTPVVLGGGIYSYGLLFKNEYVRETGRMLLESVLFAGIITDVSKVIIGRARPYTEMGPHYFKMFSFKSDYFSFPSGHSTVAFAISTVLANRINNTYASIGLYSISALTTLSRIYANDHWASDVVMGAAIGYFVGDFISSGKKCGEKKNLSYRIIPSYNGLTFNLNF